MEAAPVGAALGVLLPKLISVLEKQIDLFQNFKKDLKKLKISITMIQSFLNDAENKRITNGTVKLWLHKLEGVAFDADNVLDELDYQHLSQTVHPTQHKIKKKVSNYGLQNIVAGANAQADGSQGPSAGRETDSLGNDPIFLGRENDVSEIVKMMTTPPKGDHVFSILPIVGMGGLGKTTVAREVVDHKDIRTRFPKRFWVHVSENFDLMILFRKILTSLTRTNVKLESRQDVLEELQTYLGAGRFLLVLDDVWNDSEEKWDDFINPLRKISSATGNGIVVTTRNLSVASLVTTLPIHKLNGLSVEECWSIIKAKAFVDGNVPSEFELVGVSIAKNCQGLPLAARMVGRLLRGKSIDEWLHIEKNWLSDLRDENLVYKILKLSFDHLSSPALKKCFAYCSIYPKGYDLQRERLVELWMAEGFLEGNDDMERLGGKFFNLLLENSLLLQIVERNGDTLRACADLEKLPNTMKHLMNLRHLHLPSRIELPPEMGRLISLRTLLYFGVSDKKGCGIGELKSLKNLKGELEIYNLEKVRDKEEAKMADLLQKSNIVKLKLVWSHGQNGNESVLEGLQPHPNLKSLNICGFPGRNLPSWFSMMSELNNLMEICLRNCKECEKIPMLGHLGHLKNLYLHGMENVKSIGSSFYGIDKCSGTDNRITIFPALERLELVCMWELTEWLEYYNVVLFPRLEYLKIIMCMQLKSAPSHFPYLKELEISQVNSELPLASLCGIKLTSLTKLRINSIDDLHSLDALEILSIHDCLDALEILSIHDCPNLVAIPYPHESHGEQELVLLGLSCLRELSIRKCPGLTELPSEMIESCAESLEKLELLELSNLRMDVGMVTGCLQKMHRLSELRIADIPTTDSSKIGLSSNDSSLRGTLSTGTSCGESSHSSVFDAILKGSAKSLCTLHLYGTKHSRDLPEQLQHLTALYELHLYNFEEIEQFPDWVIGNNNNLSSSLHQICLYNCSKLRRLPSKEAMLRLTSLTNLFIYQSPMLKLTRQPDGDSEWPKISHIPRVILDGVVVPTNVV
ncbi:PREDICTED: putative disease resistance RPP13-like protein 1 [Erythranthe guttata]|uniref:putative disease resistance RPP13-like protein 1 n=1 Tax=Erythranthe guttata TaxID=4155 RepID=UPI00064DFC4F|nr:PREDICTED: putative disease resistance RPP13-like protein 1 [Erythranthe guttata]|eukprot:XP_012832978.1 PREDICTED: putative disease resistance RPP13-like protein 1 [Erythranthe guttata]